MTSTLAALGRHGPRITHGITVQSRVNLYAFARFSNDSTMEADDTGQRGCALRKDPQYLGSQVNHGAWSEQAGKPLPE